MDEENEGKISLDPPKREERTVLQSKRALRAFHSKCLDEARVRNVTYLDTDDLTLLLGGPDEVKPSFVAQVMNLMLANVRKSQLPQALIK